jgi:hypothetical protein
MVVLAASIITKLGKPLLSRQYVSMTRIRIEGLLAAFPKLVGSGKQHTYVETENVRYVYQPLEGLFLLLVTNKQSNILEDLETLRLLSKLVPDYCQVQIFTLHRGCARPSVNPQDAAQPVLSGSERPADRQKRICLARRNRHGTNLLGSPRAASPCTFARDSTPSPMVFRNAFSAGFASTWVLMDVPMPLPHSATPPWR